MFDEIPNVVVLDVDVFGLRGSHVVGSKSDASLVVLKGGSRANDGKTNGGKKLTEKHGLLRRRSKSHVFGLGCRESNAFLESTASRDMTTRHHGDEANMRAAIDAICEGRVLPYERLQRTGKCEAIVFGTGDIAENALGLFPMTASRGAHEAAKEIDLG